MKTRIENAMLLDLTELTPETAATIERIDNCMLAIFSEKSSKLQATIPFGNVMTSVVVPDGVSTHMINGSEHITAPQVAQAKPAFYVVNGKLLIDSDVSPEALSRLIAGGMINGKVLCTAPQADALRALGLHVNGKMALYPADALLHEGTLTVDEAFVARAMAGRTYFATGKVVALSPVLEVLAQKGVRLAGSGLVVRQQDSAQVSAVWSGDEGNIRWVPQGMAYLNGDAELDRIALRRHGDKLYVAGDCRLTEDLTLDQLKAGLTSLVVEGQLLIPEALLDPVLDICQQYGDLIVYPGKLLMNQGVLALSAASLEGLPQPVSLISQGMLTLAQDITPELFSQKILGLYLTGEAQVPKALHGLVLSLAKRREGHITVASDEPSQPEQPDENLKVIKNSMTLKLV